MFRMPGVFDGLQESLVTPDAAHIFWWTGPFACDTHWQLLFGWQDLLNQDLMFPAISEVIFVEKFLTGTYQLVELEALAAFGS
jgi:hypothetical protein